MRVCLGSRGVQTHCVNEFWRLCAFQMEPGLDSDAASFWLWFWMVVVRMSIFTARFPCRKENRCISLFGGSGIMFLGVLWPPGSCVACPLAQRGHSCLPNTELFLPGLLSVVLLALLGWGVFFLIALFSPWLELRCQALRCYWLSCWVQWGLVGAVSDKTLRVSSSVGWIRRPLGHFGCVVF